MPSSAKVSVSLPVTILEAAERERRATGESRSELFRRALVELLRQAREKEAVEKYLAGYVAEPETPYETEAADQISQITLAGEPWS